MGEIEIAALVEPGHDRLVNPVASAVAETYEIERRRRGKFEIRIFAHPGREFLRQFDVPPDVETQTFEAVVTDDEP